ncbi:MAG: hypothetical protein GY925_01895 [Actinomycetia bacterium]|nr:hypothetical protein [Actinomycetes bacterium]
MPTAKYTPCLDELRLGWDSVEWFAEDGRAGIKILRSFDTFLTATVTESCDVTDAVAVESGYPDIERFEDVEIQATDITIVIVPSGRQPLEAALSSVDELAGIEIDDRPVVYVVDDDVEQSVSSRVELALSQHEYVWIVDELDAEEGTVQVRSNNSAATGHGLRPGEALELIEGVVPDVLYRGSWYFTFEGGCITYEFDTKGILAETVASDAEDAIGFFPAGELRREAADAGFFVGQP